MIKRSKNRLLTNTADDLVAHMYHLAINKHSTTKNLHADYRRHFAYEFENGNDRGGQSGQSGRARYNINDA